MTIRRGANQYRSSGSSPNSQPAPSRSAAESVAAAAEVDLAAFAFEHPDWSSRGLTRDDRDLWADTTFSMGQATRWITAGVSSPDEAYRWQERALDAEEAALWTAAGFTMFEAADWFGHGFDPTVAKAWVNADVRHGSIARDLIETGSSLESATPDEIDASYRRHRVIGIVR